MAESFVGQIFLLPFNFPPRGFAFCEGQLLPISQNTALFSLLGTTFGGDGRSTFALPDLRGRAPLGFGQGPGLTDHPLGDAGGSENVTLLVPEIPQHAHPVSLASLTAAARCRNAAGNQQTPVGNVPAVDASGGTAIYASGAPDANMHPGAVSLGGSLSAASAGGGQPHTNMQPYLTLRFCIALQGVFPPRS
jgi:microcystin-dependent protein